MSAGAPLLEVRDLTVGFASGVGVVLAPRGVTLSLRAGETLGLVGESGSGKSVTLRTLVRLQAPGQVVEGEVWFGDRDLLAATRSEVEDVRGAGIAMVFQDPQSALDPVLSIETQLVEVLTKKRGVGRAEAKREAVELLRRVGIPAPERRVRDYMHQLSGGMRQRVMIAIAIACGPAVLLADEPTTALDVTIQDQILRLLADLRDASGMSMILVSHDLGVIAQECDTIAVMYAGRVVESGTASDVLDQPRHPYTAALLKAVTPAPTGGERLRLEPIAGQPPDLGALPPGCPFASRCPYADDACRTTEVRLDAPLPAHGTACLFPERIVR